ncbi:MAG TPA: zinc ribbon domain-containing protein [Methanoregulaceae archaeon]|nr:zinc ribbon domain-containing protein [Methanoregulaceae archaeon]
MKSPDAYPNDYRGTPVTATSRFCTACGAPLSPGAKFCEQCGQPVAMVTAAAPVPPLLPDVPVVIPFGAMHTGVFSRKDILLVITGDSLIAVVPKPEVSRAIEEIREQLSEALDQSGITAREFWEVSAASSPMLPRAYLGPRQVPADLAGQVNGIRSRLGLDTAPWLRYGGMRPDQIIAENPASLRVSFDDILYVRGEDLVDDRGGEDLLVVRTTHREERWRIALGGFYPARAALFSRIGKRHGLDVPGEQIVSIVPACFEPGPKEFDFQYVFNLLFSDRRLILAVTPGSEDEVERAWDHYMEAIGKKARQKGISLEAYAAGEELADAPWQEFRNRSIHEVLDADGVNYFIPYPQIRGVVYKGGRNPAITISLASHALELQADPLFAPGQLREAQQELAGKVPITIA